MRVGLITRDAAHPLLAATAELLTAQGAYVEVLAPDAEAPADPADVYLLKARTPQAVRLAATLQARGATVINSAAATARCQDRTAMAEDAHAAGLPFATTRTYRNAAELAAAEGDSGHGLVVKSRYSRKNDVVVRLEGPTAVRDFAANAPVDEPYVVQDLAPTTGWDHKLWAIGPEVFTAVRPSELHAAPAAARPPDLPLDVWRPVVHRAGEVFGLAVYGVDVLLTPEGPVVVDVNAFPGVRGRSAAPRALAALTLRVAHGS